MIALRDDVAFPGADEEQFSLRSDTPMQVRSAYMKLPSSSTLKIKRVRSGLYVTGSFFALLAGESIALVDEVVAGPLGVIAHHLIVGHAGFLSELAPSIFAILFEVVPF